MHNFIVVTDGRSLAAVERQIAKFLPGLDVRVFATSEHQGILRGTLVHALDVEYGSVPREAMFAALGIAALKPVDDETSATLLCVRDGIDLPPRTAPAALARAAPMVGGLPWHLEHIGLPQAWALANGPDAIAWGSTKVGLVDTGYLEHPGLGFIPAPWVDTANSRTIVPPPDSPDFVTVPEPGNGRDSGEGTSAMHGTRISCALGGHHPNAPGGAYYGTAPKVPLVHVRITDIVWFNHAQDEFAQAVRHLVAQRVGVINVSMGVFFAKVMKELRRAVNEAYDAGVIMVCAAGNHVNSVVAPACLPRTIAVAGVTRENRPWSGSSYGPEVDFSAPAADLRRADGKAGSASSFSYRGGGDGTSYATAISSGAAALWLAHRAAEIEAAYPQPWQRVEAFRAMARAGAHRPNGWQDGAFGAGVLDVARLLQDPLPPAADLQSRPTS